MCDSLSRKVDLMSHTWIDRMFQLEMVTIVGIGEVYEMPNVLMIGISWTSHLKSSTKIDKHVKMGGG